MFGFLKDMIAAVREGASEALVEAREEADADKAAKAAADAREAAALRTRLALASPKERIVAALAAPYRETFLGELAAARGEKRPPIYLSCADLPENEIASWKKLIARDFDVEDAEGAEAIVAALIASADGATDGACAVALVRACHVATGAAGVGYVDVPQVLAWAAPAGTTAAERFGSWHDYGRAFLLGERDAAGSNVLGRKVLARAVERLGSDDASPWRTLAWLAA